MSVQEALKLGAHDLKRYANRNLGIAFLVALVIHVVVLGFPMAASIFNTDEQVQEDFAFSGPTELEDFIEEELEAQDETPPVEDIVPPPPPPMVQPDVQTGTGTVGAAGVFEATTEEFDGPAVEDMENMHRALDGGGDGGFDPDAFGNLDDPVELKTREEKLPPAKEVWSEGFAPDVTDVSFSRSELSGNIEYPEIARREGIEGTVSVKVKISKTGKVVDVKILKSANKLFNEAARTAVRKTTFTPAIQNGHAINRTVTFQVTFKLDD